MSLRFRRGFTLIEMLAAMAVLVMLLGIVIAVTNSTTLTLRRASSGLEALASARTGFDLMNRNLSQATLNPYWEYDNPLAPTVYFRQSDLQFLIRENKQNSSYGQEIYFVAPETYATSPSLRSTSGLLNACSVFVHYGSSKKFQPGSVGTEKYRYRLMFGMQPTEDLEIFKGKPDRDPTQISKYWSDLSSYWQKLTWISSLENANGDDLGAKVTPLTDNVIALIAWPRLSSAEDPNGKELASGGKFAYDSQAGATSTLPKQPITANQLPPVIQMTMITISEAAAQRLDTKSSTPPSVIEDALQGKFTSVANYQSDLDALTRALADKNIEFQIFTTSVPMRESKWSRAQ